MVAALLLCMAIPAAAQWMWRDANGRVTASDIPPPREIPDKDILHLSLIHISEPTRPY